MRLFRRAWKTRVLTDYRQAAEAVKEKRNARELSESVSTGIQHPSETYAPHERLEELNERVDELASNAISIERTWDPDAPSPLLGPLVRVNLLIVAAPMVVVGGFILVLGAGSDPRFVAGSVVYSLFTIAIFGGLISLSKHIRVTFPLCFWAARGMAVFSFLAGLAMLTFALWFAYCLWIY
jgi:hypothetical protein